MASVYCGHCGAPNDVGTSFCGRCGTALRPAGPAGVSTPICPRCRSRNSSSARFCGACGQPLAVGAALLPVTAVGAVGGGAAYRPATRAEIAAAFRPKTNSLSPWLALVGGALVLMLGLGVVAFELRPQPPPAPRCPPTCPRPPFSPPLSPPHAFISKAYQFSLEYFPDIYGEPKDSDDRSIRWILKFRSSPVPSPFSFSGEPQQGRSPQQIVEQLQQRNYPDATLAYNIPGAEMGYNASSYGNVYDVTDVPGSGRAVTGRIIIVAAVKSNLAIQLVARGPYVRSSSRTDGHPNPSNTPLGGLLDGILNSVMWPGDNPL